MSLRDEPAFEEKLEQLQYLIDLRGDAKKELDQKYLTIESIINRLDILKQADLLDGKRVLTIGDADLTGLALAIFGNPSEVVVTDIDDRLSELYFEASMEFDLPVRFVYHDMRIKIIAILKKQYSLVLFEPPRTEGGIEVFMSRAVQILEPGLDNGMMVTIPSEERYRHYFNRLLRQHNIEIKESHDGVINYLDGSTPADYISVEVPADIEPWIKSHFVRPFYEQEVQEDLHEYKCVCRESFMVGKNADFESIEELEDKGCPECDYDGVFAYTSKIQIK